MAETLLKYLNNNIFDDIYFFKILKFMKFVMGVRS